MNSNSLKKLGRRKANTWGRCGSKKEKRYASKGVRKFNKLSAIEEDTIPKGEYNLVQGIEGWKVKVK